MVTSALPVNQIFLLEIASVFDNCKKNYCLQQLIHWILTTAMTGISTPRFPALLEAFSAGPFSLALSLALFPSSPSWTNSSSKFISSSSTRCSTWMLAAMLARALMTAKEQCLRRKNSYEQAIHQVLYCQCFLRNTDSNSCNKATDVFPPSFFTCGFYEQHITSLTIEMQLV